MALMLVQCYLRRLTPLRLGFSPRVAGANCGMNRLRSVMPTHSTNFTDRIHTCSTATESTAVDVNNVRTRPDLKVL